MPRRRFRPFSARTRFSVGAILLTFLLFTSVTVGLSVMTTSRSKNRAVVVETAARQRTLAQQYLSDVLLRQRGAQTDPATTASIMARSAQALLNGGAAPAVPGDDDDTIVPVSTDPTLRGQIRQEQRLISDYTRSGQALLAGHGPPTRLTAHEQLPPAMSAMQRLRVLEALTSNVSLNVARSIASSDDRNIESLLRMQVAIGVCGLLLAVLLALALVRATRRQTEHFRSLITSSSELVLVLGTEGCRYASQSVVSLLGVPESELLGEAIYRFVHDDDRELLVAAAVEGTPARLMVRVRNAAREWRHLDAHVTDLRSDRHIQSVVVNARDITERVALERELTDQARRDTFASQLVEALEMADDEDSAYTVVERAMIEVEPSAPMELLLSDSSRAHLERAASSPTAGAPSCPVESPFSCVAVRRGNPVVFESSEGLNACPKLRDRPSGSCSAVCVPISFMGRALGVLHTTGPVDRPLDRDRVSQLTTLATQAGTRIGTVRAFERTQLQAATDELTGLDNRRAFEQKLRRFKSQRRTFALAIADLDHFKQLNDKHGHEAGDRALRLFSQVALDALRDNDMIGRWGGEEFIILFPDLDQERALAVVERFRGKLATAHTGQHPRFTASFGVTDSTHAETVQELIQIADAALYVAKEAGRDQARTDAGLTGVGPEGSPRSLVPDDPRGARRPPRKSEQKVFHQATADDDPDQPGAEPL